MRRRLLIVLGSLVALLVVAWGAVWAASERRLRATWDAPAEALGIPADSVALARGEHLARAVLNCTLCHGEDLGGAVYADMGPVGIVAGRNLTRGRGGVGGERTEGDWVRALRYGVRRDGTSLIAMPSEVFTNLTDADLGAVIAWARQVPPVDRETERSHFRALGRALLATGRLDVLVASKTPRPESRWAGTPGPTADYGRYLADVSGCHGCHGHGLSGGKVAGPPGLPPASNLTPSGPLANWSEADFFRALREGKRPDGSAIDPFMPWRTFSRMTDDESRALWLYLRGVPPREFGNR